jgi:ABC-2 type transport system ATP-binding protein
VTPTVVLSAEGLTKRFGKREVVSDVSFEITAGEVFGFLGPNGAGKTTTIRMLVGLARPDRGRVRIAGFDLQHDFAKAMSHVGCIVESTDLYPYLTGRENLLHFARMLENGAESRIPELARLVFLEGRLEDRVATYSLGMRQRLGLAQALLGEPDLLILDEPANGLDPAGIREIRQLIRHLAADRGLAVFVSSHLLSEVEQMCDRVAIIHRGRTLALGPVRELLERRGAERLLFRARPAERAAEVLRPFGRDGSARVEGEESVSSDVVRERVPEALAALAAAGVLVFGVERQASTLEEIFLEVTGGETV